MSPDTRTVWRVWWALLALLAASIALAAIPLGPWNAWLALVLAVAKTALVVWFYMHLRRAPPSTRLAAAVGFAMLAGLTLLDFGLRG